VKFAGCLVDLRGKVLCSDGLFLRIDNLESLDFNDSDFGPEAKLDQPLVMESLSALGEQLEDGPFVLFFEFQGIGMDARCSRIKFQDQQVVKSHDQVPLTVKNVQCHFLL
jgi:hypothetical protein